VSFTFATPVDLARFVAVAVPDRVIAILEDLVEAPA